MSGEIPTVDIKHDLKSDSITSNDTQKTQEINAIVLLENSSNIGPSSTTTKTLENDNKWPRRLVYITMLVHGVGTLMPWHGIINAKDYFVNYKLSENYTNSKDSAYYAQSFLPSVGLYSMLPGLVFSWVNTFLFKQKKSGKPSPNRRVCWSLIVEAALFVVTLIFAITDTSQVAPAIFFYLTMLTIAFMNIAGAIYQSSIYGIGAELNYAAALVLGANICGTIVPIMNIFSMIIATSKKAAAVVYFSSALVVLFVCLITYLALPKNTYYQSRQLMTSNPSVISTIAENQRLPITLVFKQCWNQCLNLFLIFFITLSVFPTVMSDVKRYDQEFFISDKYFTEIVCFLLFNLFAMIGSCVTEVVKIPSPKYLWIPVAARVVFIPFFLACNYLPYGVAQNTTHFVFGDWWFTFGSILFGVTNGYFSSLGIIYSAKSVSDEHFAPLASMLGSSCLVSGVFIGVNFSRVMPWARECMIRTN